MADMARHQFDSSTLSQLVKMTSAELVVKGRKHYDKGRVTLVEESTDAQGDLFILMVNDPQATTRYYQVNLVRYFSGELGGGCSCPLTTTCEHMMSGILFLIAEGALMMGTDPGPSEPGGGNWRDQLESVLPDTTGLSPEPSAPDTCLFFSYEEGSVRIRPGERAATGNWVKGKARWDRVIYRRDEQIRGLLLQLHEIYMLRGGGSGGYAYGLDWLPLDLIPTRHLWDILTDLRDAGVEFITWDGRNPVDLDETPARVRVAVRLQEDEEDDEDGDYSADDTSGAGRSVLSVSAELRYGESAAPDMVGMNHFFLGDPATVVAEVQQVSTKKQQITLRQLTEPASESALALVATVRSMRIEQEDIGDFERNYLPRITDLLPVESPDNSYAAPEPEPGILTLEVSPVVDEDDNLVRVRLFWEWDRSGGVHDTDHEASVEAAVWDAGVSVDDWSLPRNEAIPFLAETLPVLDDMEYVRVTVTEEVPDFRPAQDAPTVTMDATGDAKNDWFSLNFTVSVGGEEVNFVDLFTALSREEEIFVLPSGTYFPLDTPELDQLRRIIEEAKTLNDVTTDGLKISRYQVDMWAELLESGIIDAQSNQWWTRIRSLVEAEDGAEGDGGAEVDGGGNGDAIAVPDELDATLRDYQLRGYRWLETLRRNELGGILADDMGLGKTVQVIAMMLAALDQDHQADPFLVVAPTSVVGNWVREIEKFAPGMAVLAVDKTEKKRGTTLQDELFRPDGAPKVNVVVTSYTLFRLDIDGFNDLTWSGAVFDEAQMIKNHSSKAYACARKLETPVKIAVTGTPLENNLLEMWSLISLTCPGLLGSKTHFTEFFRNPVEKEGNADRLDLLQRRLRPFLLRRTKDLVADDLPAKTENVLELELSPQHRKIYDRRLQRERQKVLGLLNDMNSHRFEVFRSLTLLRQLALDSELAGEESSPSAKLTALSELLTSVTAEGHKVLVLSQFTRFLAKARDVATAAGIDSLYLDGSTTNRQAVIDAFRDSGDSGDSGENSEGDSGGTGGAPVFFISLKAGGFGLNLTEADYVVLLDPWWNPATESQAVDRAHRIGQTRSVMVYRLVSADTIESKVMELKKTKAALFDRVLDGGGSVESDGLSTDDIRALLG